MTVQEDLGDTKFRLRAACVRSQTPNHRKTSIFTDHHKKEPPNPVVSRSCGSCPSCWPDKGRCSHRGKGVGVTKIHMSPDGMLSDCTWAQYAAGTKAQRETWLVSGLKDHRSLSVKRET